MTGLANNSISRLDIRANSGKLSCHAAEDRRRTVGGYRASSSCLRRWPRVIRIASPITEERIERHQERTRAAVSLVEMRKPARSLQA